MRIAEAKAKIEAAGGNWETFQKWMGGQTVGMYENGEPNIYDWDVDRFIRYKCDPKNEPLWEWD
jgi:hypothetical protein